MARIPLYSQYDSMDCGPTCIRMIASFYGKDFSLEYLRDMCSITNRGGTLLGFDYVDGYEYHLKINETNYLDHRMGEPAWTEHKLLDVLSKEKKETEGLPEDLIPEWYKECNEKQFIYSRLTIQ